MTHRIQSNTKRLLGIFILFSCILGSAIADADVASTAIAKARELIDTYYGNSANLQQAAKLLDEAHQINPKSAEAYIQAARIVVMGGQTTYGNMRPNTMENYAALLDKAIELDPKIPKAHILKSQVFREKKNYKQQLAELDIAKSLGGDSDPWLEINYISYYEKTGNFHEAFRLADTFVSQRGVGKTASDRKAYISAISTLFDLIDHKGQTFEEINFLPARAIKERYPTDAWTPLSFAESFFRLNYFDAAIDYSRVALKTMNFGAAKVCLASSLYAKVAQAMHEKRKDLNFSALKKEANSFGYSKADLMYFYEMHGAEDEIKHLMPTLQKIIPDDAAVPPSKGLL